jgi:hypothetical protein
MPLVNYNRTITQSVITQGAAGSLDLVAAPGAGLKIYVVNIVVVAAGAATLKFQENAVTDLTGAMALAANGGIVDIGNGFEPVLQTQTANLKLNLVSTTSAVTGWLRYFIDP